MSRLLHRKGGARPCDPVQRKMCSGVLVVVRAVAVVAIIGEVCVGVRLLCSWLLFVRVAVVAQVIMLRCVCVCVCVCVCA